MKRINYFYDLNAKTEKTKSILRDKVLPNKYLYLDPNNWQQFLLAPEI